METKRDAVVRGAFLHRNALVAYANALPGDHAVTEERATLYTRSRAKHR